MVLTNKDIDLKPSFVNILICLVRFTNLFTTFSGGESSKKNIIFLKSISSLMLLKCPSN